MEKKIDNLPVYKMVMGEVGIEAVALVDDPAIQEFWIAMNKHEKPKELKLELVNEAKRIVMTPMLIANQAIYRKMKDKDGVEKEFWVYFPPETIEMAVQKLMRDKLTDSVNKMHNAEQSVDGVYMYQIYLVNRELGIMPPKAYKDIEDGSAIVFYKFDNDQAWADALSGKYKGISIEGNFVPQSADLSEGEVLTVAQSLLK